MKLNGGVGKLYFDFSVNPSSSAVTSVFIDALTRGLIDIGHVRRAFASLQAARSLPRQINERFAKHFTMWLEIVNQPYFKPIITAKHRLNKLIRVLANNPCLDMREKGLRIVDLGTGQPPYTTIDLAERFCHAQIHGFDLYFPSSMLLRRNGAYALFDSEDRLMAVHAPDISVLHSMVIDWAQTERDFKEMLDTLKVAIPPAGDPALGDDSVLIKNPTARLKAMCANPNLHFHVNQPGNFTLPFIEDESVDVLWSFNCLLHYSLEARLQALRKIATKVRLGGIIMEGYTSPAGDHAIYSIWQKHDRQLVMQEFGFSVPNLQYPLWPLHERDPQVEMMNHFVGSVKSNEELRRRIDWDFDTAGLPTQETSDKIIECLIRQGYSARVENTEFIVIEHIPSDPFSSTRSDRSAYGLPLESTTVCRG